jgi:hypothetical protein
MLTRAPAPAIPSGGGLEARLTPVTPGTLAFSVRP